MIIWIVSCALRGTCGQDDALYGVIFDSTVRSHILRSILEWWSRESERFLRRTTTHRYFEIDPYERVTLVLQVIINCVLDRNNEELEIGGLLRSFFEGNCRASGGDSM